MLEAKRIGEEHRMRNILSLLLLLLLISPVNAQEAIQRIDIVDYGIYTSRVGATRSAPDTEKGSVNIVKEIELVGKTRAVPAKLGTQFGFSYIPVGPKRGIPVTLHFVIFSPQPGVRDPNTARTPVKEEADNVVHIGKRDFVAQTLEKPSDLVPGTYIFQIWYAERKLAEERFTVVKQ